ncbi:MAG: hypothetical protein K6A31_11075, partial [Fibrobacter sp.]|nr:hypothetical protein [Fibrobacter sp.]
MRLCVWVWALALMTFSSAFGAVTFYVSVPSDWAEEGGLYLVFSGSSQTYSLTEEDGYYTATYNNSIGGNKSVTVYSASETSDSYRLSGLSDASVIYLTVSSTGEITASA